MPPQRKLEHSACISTRSCTRPPTVLDPLSVAAVVPPRVFQHFLTTLSNHALVPTTPSYIKDSSHIIALLEQTHVPPNTLLVTIDVTSLYANIPQDEGTDACLKAIGLAAASHTSPSVLLELFNIVLKRNIFSFDNSMYQQIQGMAMGTTMAPSYANLFMDRLERAFLAQEPILPLVWKRYIDDILCIWTGSRSQLDVFFRLAQQDTPSIKSTWSISDMQVQFLDLNIHKEMCFPRLTS